MTTRRVFLDHQATTPLLPEVWQVMQPFFTENFGSAASFHQDGLKARDALARSRGQFERFIGAEGPDQILFTASGTEANNLAIKGTLLAHRRRGRHVVLSAIEHPSVNGSVEFLEREGFSATRVPVSSCGVIDPEEVRAHLTAETVLLAVHQANYDIGTIQPLRELAAVAHEGNAVLFVDATFSGGWLPIQVQEMGIDLLSLAPHRFYGPKGVGVLYRRRGARLASLIHGGAQEGGLRAGTENVPAIAGAGAAAEAAAAELAWRGEHTARLQRKLWEGLRGRIPQVQLNGPEPGALRLSTNLNISIEFVEGEGVMLMCDVAGIAIASGTSCVSKALKLSPVLTAIGVEHGLGQGSIILSLGRDNSEADIDAVLDTLPKIVERLRGMSPLWDEFQHGRVPSQLAAP